MRTIYLDSAARKRSIGGAITSLITPFRDDAIDSNALMDHVSWQIASGIDGLAVCGLAGEGPVLSDHERQTVIAICVETAAAKVPVIATTGSNCTAKTIAATRQARNAGASAALITVPYYSKPTQRGILAHFESIADATDLPLIIDNRPAHAGIDLTSVTIERLGEIGSVIGICDGGGDIGRLGAWTELLPRRVGLYTSNDAVALGFAMTGGAGCFSDAANVAPQMSAAVQHQAAAGNLAAALSLQQRLLPLWQALAAESIPATLKQAMHLDGRPVSTAVRLPLVSVEPETETAIRDALTLLHGLEHKPCTVVHDLQGRSMRI
ncbi:MULTISPECIES: 4-hydroxy-tetrahydrodipicolinate synthase [Rhizobium]|uniref:4-hydroxy-tetrahydrodipicolinate synthase n=1 Tax=Rhizobium rhododendri TaxID=2506430 RepID=A0ABY8IKU4_9HYPH|nr:MULTISPECIES: 4-hydroxy-tetrahydrodipicolinate synthase [Rhizobium]MBZ5761407.1 4-hydroxy-tetrahydrodipicolinate synthase [Rhizobium sp. VS19-DR96]MBZ5767355.1 4-hydroxy-tetrahydrodipicolinate synthase [Rhizobium sp. VS19-DR129.2]MBZ5775196.1 4-hydroxy-tetrahydrodipicolinate synthase [Rhizobium sp. VS19-DRK62.2]MBZ5785839.1 4-hydroxy-tetrahydrodipicolinate synthase [Rhizobium sp. VS19-DR121]MBZ5803265.1 4-hydroxy-tetrahydrodipicolinate synthase [Rhizobium sp. VS19-DR181]